MSIRGWNELFVTLMHLRMAQKEYEKNNGPLALNLKRKYEKEIDDFVEEHQERLIAEKQKALFGGKQ